MHSEAFTGIVLNAVAAVTEIIIILLQKPSFKPMKHLSYIIPFSQ